METKSNVFILPSLIIQWKGFCVELTIYEVPIYFTDE